MVDKKLRPGVWGDPPSYRQSVNPVPLRGAATLAGGASRGTGGTGGGGGSSGGAARGLHTRAGAAAAAAAQPAAAATPGGPAKGSDAPRTNIGIFGCMNAGKSSLMNRITRR